MLQDRGVNPTVGINFEIRGRNGGEFWMAWHSARCDLYGWQCDIVAFVNNTLSNAIVKPGVWYTMKLIVNQSPFTITGEVYDENDVLVGSLTVDDATNFTFENIKAVVISTLCGGTFYMRNFMTSGIQIFFPLNLPLYWVFHSTSTEA
jgi:hypothetical protein